MKVTRLYTHWSPAEAHTIIQFLDHLRDQLCEVYGDPITSLLREAGVPQGVDELQTELELEFDDDIEF